MKKNVLADLLIQIDLIECQITSDNGGITCKYGAVKLQIVAIGVRKIRNCGRIALPNSPRIARCNEAASVCIANVKTINARRQ